VNTTDPLAVVAALPTVAPQVEQTRAAVDRLLGHRVLRRTSAQVSTESALRGARASAALAGADWALEEIRRRTDFAAEPGGAVVHGALRVSAEVGTLVETWRHAPLQVLARLHVVAAADVLPEPRLGRPRLEGEPVVEELGEPSERESVAGPWGPPPSPRTVAVRLEDLARLLVSDTSAPALVVAAVTHAELLALRPFGWGNGLVARAAQRLVLVSRGLDPKAVTAPEVGHAELGRDAYADALRGYLTGSAEGVAGWVGHCAEAVQLGAREAVAVCEAIQRGAVSRR
jgi:hypothetical protein